MLLINNYPKRRVIQFGARIGMHLTETQMKDADVIIASGMQEIISILPFLNEYRHYLWWPTFTLE